MPLLLRARAVAGLMLLSLAAAAESTPTIAVPERPPASAPDRAWLGVGLGVGHNRLANTLSLNHASGRRLLRLERTGWVRMREDKDAFFGMRCDGTQEVGLQVGRRLAPTSASYVAAGLARQSTGSGDERENDITMSVPLTLGWSSAWSGSGLEADFSLRGSVGGHDHSLLALFAFTLGGGLD